MSLFEKVLCISDLHLNADQPDIADAFSTFLQNTAINADALFILGDFFNVWIGDDDPSAFAAQVKAELKALADTGVAVFIMHGNRDFLLGTDYATLCGASLIAEPFTVRSGAEEYLLLHGDSLCTDDVDYQQFRQMVREPQWQAQFLAQPLTARRDFARQARAQSQAATAGKEMGIMDVNPSAVVQLLQDTQHTQLIHGHTHRPARHDIALQQPIAGHESAVRMVLGDWDKQGWFAQLQDGKLSLQHFPL